MSKFTVTIVAIALIGFGVWQAFKDQPTPPNPIPVPTPVPAPKYPAPSAAMQTVVSTLLEYRGKKNANIAAQFYWDCADVVSRDKNILKTTSQFRAAHQRAQALLAQGTDIIGSLPGLSARIEVVLVFALGLEDGPLNREKLVEACRAIAWGLYGS